MISQRNISSEYIKVILFMGHLLTRIGQDSYMIHSPGWYAKIDLFKSKFNWPHLSFIKSVIVSNG